MTQNPQGQLRAEAYGRSWPPKTGDVIYANDWATLIWLVAEVSWRTRGRDGLPHTQ